MPAYKSYCWSLGTTSFRMVEFNRKIEEQLKLLNQFWLKPEYTNENWSSNNLGLSLDEQFMLSSSRKFYLYLRNKVENKGIFIHCFNGVSVEVARGFAIYDKKHPIIGLNADDRHPAKCFSIIHELVHIIKRESSLCNDNYSSFAALSEEIFCNAVAGELLVPNSALNALLLNGKYSTPYSIADIKLIADTFSVSKRRAS